MNRKILTGMGLVVLPLVIAALTLQLWSADLSVPFFYGMHDDVWQYVLTKALRDNGWILDNAYLGAPDVAHWQYHSAAQTSALHSIIMKGLFLFVIDPILVQQIYYLANFPLITITTFFVARQLGSGRLAGLCAGLIFAFTTYRYNSMFFAFLANYFSIPLVLLPSVWLMVGGFEESKYNNVVNTGYVWLNSVRARIIFSIVAVALVACSDGYYAFFACLLMAFSGTVAVVRGQSVGRISIIMTIVLPALVVGIQLLLMIPLQLYKAANAGEFLVNGLPDPTLNKSPFEAEVYSSSLKLLFAPIIEHRIPFLGQIGEYVVGTSDAARLYKIISPVVSLGTVCSVAFIFSMLLLLAPRREASTDAGLVRQSLRSLAAFAFLCATAGGIGAIVALIYPTIRAYDRMPLFLICILAVSLALWVLLLERRSSSWRRWSAVVTVVVTALAIFDQTPRWSGNRDPAIALRYKAEAEVVEQIEQQSPGAMIYQMPFSQYLTDNQYYGWGAFSQLRMYLHSRTLRWSNGASKNSPVDQWHMRVSQLPVAMAVREVWAAGFAGILIDRRVLSTDQYDAMRAEVAREVGGPQIENDVAEQTYFALPDPGFRVVYGSDFKAPVTIVWTGEAIDPRAVPAWISFAKLKEAAAEAADSGLAETPVASLPDLIVGSPGDALFAAQAQLHGDVLCNGVVTSDDTIALTLVNRSQFGWSLNTGQNPVSVGVHILNDGTVREFDPRWRLQSEAYVPAGGAALFEVPIAELVALPGTSSTDVMQFELLVEGVAWSSLYPGNATCSVPVAALSSAG